MTQPKNTGCWLYWLFLYGVATVPAALFGGVMASSFIYNYDHAHRSRMSDHSYATLLNGGEIAAALVCAVPGFVWVGWSQLRDRRKEQEAKKIQSVRDDTVWPPPPRE